MHHNNLVAAFLLISGPVGLASTLHAAPLFYLSDQPLGVAQPGMFSMNNPASGTAGQLNIYAMTDVRLSGVSLDLYESGGGIRFSGLDVVNDARWWSLDGPQRIEDSKITNIGGGAIPGMAGNGIGPGDFVDANFHPTSGYLLATVDYEVVNSSLSSNFELKVGNNTIADWQGGSPMVHFGDLSQSAVPGHPPNLERLPDPLPAQPRPPRDPVPDPILNPIPLPHRPGFIDPLPPPDPDPVDPDSTIVDVPTDVPSRWDEFSGEVILRPFVWLTPELRQVIDETGVAVDMDYAPVLNDQLYFSRIIGTSAVDHASYLHSVANIPNVGINSDSAAGDYTILLASTADGEPRHTASGLERALLNSLPASEYFRATEDLALLIGLTATADLPLSTNAPEPATIALVALALLAIAGLRSDHRS